MALLNVVGAALSSTIQPNPDNSPEEDLYLEKLFDVLWKFKWVIARLPYDINMTLAEIQQANELMTSFMNILILAHRHLPKRSCTKICTWAMFRQPNGILRHGKQAQTTLAAIAPLANKTACGIPPFYWRLCACGGIGAADFIGRNALWRSATHYLSMGD